MSQCRSGVLVGEKRKWDVAALGSDISGVRAEFDRTGMTALDQSLREINEGGSLGSARDELAAPLMQSPIAFPQLGNVVDPVNPNSSSNMSTEGIYFNSGEGQTEGLDLLQDFDAPILQIMNTIPALTGWPAQDDIVVTTEPAVYHGQ
ncbi:unnamed protein product [Penicillium egyptiacum]|uniref:Uncharacterized protein n=1 Tax=Penicillium egyptiacum TaxID=1303716 RepID=A0A9W4KJ83_9EURO|nr:unnamed protein product [Penicillium egyptiacum]